MLHLQKLPQKDIYSFTIEGELTEADMRRFYDLLAEKADGPGKLRVLGIINEFPRLKDFRALGETVKTKGKALQGIGKYAIISDQHWMEAVLPVGNFLTPGLPIKHFARGEREQALAWLESDADQKSAPEPTTMKLTREAADSPVFSTVIDGQITEAGLSELYQAINQQQEHTDLRLLVEVKNFDGFDHFGTLLDGIKGDLAMMSRVEKYALVSDKSWADKLGKVADFVPGISMQVFDQTERTQAVAWLRE